MHPVDEHRKAAPKTLSVAVITVSTSRYEKLMKGEEPEDVSGAEIRTMLEAKGHKVQYYRLIPDDKTMVRLEVLNAVKDGSVDAVILTGGTGFTESDVTVEALAPLFDREIEGFGELFRMLSYKEVGSASMLSRATAGIISKKPVFCLPGSPDAVRLAMNLILDELPHLKLMLSK